MNVYSEFASGDRKAVISKDLPGHWDTRFQKWEVTMYIGEKVIKKTLASTEGEAVFMAENFIGPGFGPTLLNENNG